MRRCLILFGLTCIVGQVLALREIAAAFHGNELVYGAALAAWLLLFALGSAGLGRFTAGRSLGVPAFALALAAAGALVPFTVLLARTIRWILFANSPMTPSLSGVLLATFIVLAPLCLVLGFFYALACSIASRLEESAALAATRVYLGEAVGAFVGGILLTYVLLLVMDAFQIALLVAALNCLAAFAVWRHSSRAADKRGWALLLCGALFAATAVSALGKSAEPFWSYGKVIDLLSLTPRFPGRVLKHSVDTPYGRVEVVEHRGPISRAGDRAAEALVEHGLTTGHVPGQVDFYESGSLAGTAHMDRSAEEAAYLAALSHPAPHRMLVLGGAANGVLSKALDLTWMQVDDVELDPELVAAIRQYGDEEQRAALNSRARVLTDLDGRLVVKRAAGAYDVILSTAPNPTTGLINRFYTREFFAEARRALTGDGVLALSLEGSPVHMSEPDRALAAGIYATLRSVFQDSVVVAPSDDRIYFLASKAKSFVADAATWRARMIAWRLRPVQLTEAALNEMGNPAHVAALRANLKSGAVNTDMKPAAYYQALLIWAEAFQVRGLKLLNWAPRLDLWAVLLFIAAATGILALAATFASEPLWIGLSATRVAAGVAGIVLEMALVFAFQSICGYVYGQLGILFAAFMIGAALGALLAVRRAVPRASLGTLALCQMALALLAALFVPVLFWLEKSGGWTAGATVVISLLNFGVGALVGAQYPVSVALGAAAGDPSERPGALAAGLYALELGGACAGALLAGTLLIPVLGIFATCWAICALSLASLPLLALAARRR